MRGGRRRKHVPKAFTADEVRELRKLREAGARYKELEKLTGFCRGVLSRAVNGADIYEGVK